MIGEESSGPGLPAAPRPAPRQTPQTGRGVTCNGQRVTGYFRVTIQHPHCSEHFVFFAVGGQSGFTACPPPGTAQIRQISKLI